MVGSGLPPVVTGDFTFGTPMKQLADLLIHIFKVKVFSISALVAS